MSSGSAFPTVAYAASVPFVRPSPTTPMSVGRALLSTQDLARRQSDRSNILPGAIGRRTSIAHACKCPDPHTHTHTCKHTPSTCFRTMSSAGGFERGSDLRHSAVVDIHEYVHVRVYVFMYLCLYSCVYRCMCLHVCTPLCLYAYICTGPFMSICVYVHMYGCI